MGDSMTDIPLTWDDTGRVRADVPLVICSARFRWYQFGGQGPEPERALQGSFAVLARDWEPVPETLTSHEGDPGVGPGWVRHEVVLRRRAAVPA